MKKTIYVVAPNDRLKELFMLDKQVEFTVRLEKVEEQISCDVIVLYGNSVSPNEIAEVRSLYPDIPMFYKLHNVINQHMTKNVSTVCKAYNVIALDEKLTDEQVVTDVLYQVFEREKKIVPRVVSFFGTHSGSGVSTTVLNTAKRLAERVEEKVLVLSLNAWDPSDYLLNYKGSYLNDLKIELKTNSLTEERFQEAVHYYENEGFYHLAGNRDIKMQRYFKVNEIERLIELAKSCFDVVLIDGGTHFDNACYAQSYLSADLKFLLTTQETKGYAGYWPYVYQQMIEPIEGTSQNYMLIINRYMPDVSLINDKDMQKEMDMSLLTTIPDQDVHAHIAIAQKKLLLDIGDSSYKKAINTIVNSIIARAQLKAKLESEEPKKGVFRFLNLKSI